MKKKINLSIDNVLLAKLDRMAERERRSRSNMLETVLADRFEVDRLLEKSRQGQASDAKK
jgi:metal-responsive CopG/Arc/MetJ family transcriptional regulator